jgi:hypothetical protein
MIIDLVVSTLFASLSLLFWRSAHTLDKEQHPGRCVMATLSGFFTVMSIGVLL